MAKDTHTLIIDSMERGESNYAADNGVTDLLGFQMQIENEIMTLVQMHNHAGLLARRQNKSRRQSVILGLKDDSPLRPESDSSKRLQQLEE